MKDSCIICYTETRPSQKVELGCRCVFCESCLTSSFIAQTKDVGFWKLGLFVCPVSKYHDVIPKEDAFKLTKSRAMQESISKALLRVYITRQSDIRSCPRFGCEYAGILPSQNCGDELSCEKCGFEWRDSSQYGILDNPFHVFQKVRHLPDSILTKCQKYFVTKECPKCSISISKSGGCFHMTCRKCKHEFCWYCRYPYHNHSSLLCIATFGFKVLFLAVFPMYSALIPCLLYTSPSPRDS
eukprot:TRINITY_DN17318_c0_g1_i1.p1 TRINITY_DN17318_c0_g1~~TRINITY_DN17318_c0_g1_i1.p1  ORF type:complete len:241 (-),score=-11.81 TRINITY_DN17318_c0_g1_i1:38-760(-)